MGGTRTIVLWGTLASFIVTVLGMPNPPSQRRNVLTNFMIQKPKSAMPFDMSGPSVSQLTQAHFEPYLHEASKKHAKSSKAVVDQVEQGQHPNQLYDPEPLASNVVYRPEVPRRNAVEPQYQPEINPPYQPEAQQSEVPGGNVMEPPYQQQVNPSYQPEAQQPEAPVGGAMEPPYQPEINPSYQPGAQQPEVAGGNVMEPSYQPEPNPPSQPKDIASSQYLEQQSTYPMSQMNGAQSNSGSFIHSEPPAANPFELKLKVSPVEPTNNKPDPNFNPFEQTGPRPADQFVNQQSGPVEPQIKGKEVSVPEAPAPGPDPTNQQVAETYNAGPEISTPPSTYPEVKAAPSKAKAKTAVSLSNTGPTDPSVPKTNNANIVPEAKPSTTKPPTTKKPVPKKPLSRAEKKRLQRLERKRARQAKKAAKAAAKKAKKLKAKQRRLAKKRAREARRKAKQSKKSRKSRTSRKSRKSNKRSNKKRV